MTGFKAFRYYIALKLHFTKEKFDVFENKGHIKGSYAAFDARNDKYLFEKLARKFPKDQDIIQFIVANLSIGNDNIIYGMEEAEALSTRMGIMIKGGRFKCLGSS